MATQIPTPPTAPLRSDPSTFAARREAWLTWEEDDLFPGINTIATEAEADAATATTQAGIATTKAAEATAAAATATAASAAITSGDTVGTSTTSLTVGTGSKAFTTQAGKAWLPGMTLKAYNASGTMSGTVASYASTTLTLTVTETTGSGTLADWAIFPTTIVPSVARVTLSSTVSITDYTVPYNGDSSGGAFTVTLSGTPTTGAAIEFADLRDTWGTNNITLTDPSRNFIAYGTTYDSLALDISGGVTITLYDAVANVWRAK